MTRERRIGGMATMPGRERSLTKAVASIAPQLDELRLHINDYGRWKPVLLPRNVTCSYSEANLGDQEKLLRIGENTEAWYFTCDDDLVFPPDYVETMIASARYGLSGPKPVAVSAHGAQLCLPFHSYYKSRRVYHCTQGVCALGASPGNPRLRAHGPIVDVIGTGCALFRPGLRLRREDYPSPNMADVWTAIALARRGIMRRVVPHRANWIQLADPDNRETIWHASRRADGSALDTGQAQTDAIKRFACLFPSLDEAAR